MNLKEPVRRFLAAALFASLIATACGQPTSPPKEMPTFQATPTVTLAPKPTATAIPTAIPTAMPKVTSTTIPTSTPTVVATATPSPSPKPPLIEVRVPVTYIGTINGVTVTVTLALNPSIMPGQCITRCFTGIGLNTDYYGYDTAVSMLIKAVMTAHWLSWMKDDSARQSTSFDEFMSKLAHGETLTYKIWGNDETSDSVLPKTIEVDPSKPVTIVLSRRVKGIKSQFPDPVSGVWGSGVWFVVGSDGGLILEQTFPPNMIHDDEYKAGKLVVSGQASLCVSYALSRLSLPLSRQVAGKEVPDAPNEKVDKIVRGVRPLVLVVWKP